MGEARTGTHSGETLGTYELHELVGSGGAAEVYRGTDTLLGRDVAVKVLLPDLSQDESFIQRFRGEARRVATLQHPNVVPVYQYGEERGLLYLVMPLMVGGSLRERLLRERRLESRVAVRIALQIASALARAHAALLIHRDVKPENILFSAQGDALLTDFGLARDLPETGAPWWQHNTTGIYGIPVGTPEYMAPEQFQRIAVLDQRVDVYALGVVLYEMLTGRVPFTGTPRELAQRDTSRLCPPPSAVSPSVWPGLDARVMTALAADPNGRYGTVEEFGQALYETARAYLPPLALQRPTTPASPAPVTAAPATPAQGVTVARGETASLPAYYRLPTPPELMEPAAWPLPLAERVGRQRDTLRLVIVGIAALALLAAAGTGVAALLGRGNTSASSDALVGQPSRSAVASPSAPRPTRTAHATQAATAPSSPTAGMTATPSPTPTPTPLGNSARFTSSPDTATQGSWVGVYGADGYEVFEDKSGISLPGYATVTRAANTLDYTWAATTTDPRALVRPESTTSPPARIAACWYSSQPFTIAVSIGDGKAHRVALYFLDWGDSQTRAETITVIDPTSDAVLDQRYISKFGSGVYLVWTVSGSVVFNITNNGSPNAVVSGIFFG